MSSDIIPKWDEFAWAIFLFGAIDRDSDYQDLMKEKQFLNRLRRNPMELQPSQTQNKLIKFLNRWKCRVNNSQETAHTVQTTIHNLLPYLQVLNDSTTGDLNFTRTVNVNNSQMVTSRVIEHCYTEIRNIGNRFAATATSKLLHILQPKIFVMWDNYILEH